MSVVVEIEALWGCGLDRQDSIVECVDDVLIMELCRLNYGLLAS